MHSWKARAGFQRAFTVGGGMELMTPKGDLRFALEYLENRAGESIGVSPGDAHVMYLPVFPEVDLQFALLIRNL